MDETEVPYQLWKEVYDWATNDAGGGKRADGGDFYGFANAGCEGYDGSNGAAPTMAKQEPVTTINWCDSIVWCNALTEYYNANNGSENDLVCVYTYSEGIIHDSRDKSYSLALNIVMLCRKLGKKSKEYSVFKCSSIVSILSAVAEHSTIGCILLTCHRQT